MTQFADEVRSRIVSQFLSDISRILLNLLKYFNDTVISTFRVPALPVLFIILDLNLINQNLFYHHHLVHL